jgi:hypothetical protein
MEWYEKNLYEDAEEFLEEDSISATEEGFMRGYRKATLV